MQIGTLIYTWLKGELVGTDEFSNRYYRARRVTSHQRPLRWVLYKGGKEASKVPPEWHAWLHHTTEDPLTESAALAEEWQKGHRPNLTGTVEAYRPSGHQMKGGRRAGASADYQAWTPPGGDRV